MILGIDHIGIAVHDLCQAGQTFERLLDRPPSDPETPAAQPVRVCFVPDWERTRLELLEPADAAGPVARFLERRGEGLHHICLAVDDLQAEAERLERAGFVLIDRTPRRGHSGWVLFVHPKAAHGVLIELLQRDDTAAGEPAVPAGRSG
jgi:methylmalonyl-CoA/ethylmalonyl-CoA epimerase